MATKHNKDLKKGDIMYSAHRRTEEIWKYEITKVVIKDSVVIAKVKDLYKETGCSYIIGFKEDFYMRDINDKKCYHEYVFAHNDIKREEKRQKLSDMLWHKDALEKLGLKVTITT